MTERGSRIATLRARAEELRDELERRYGDLPAVGLAVDVLRRDRTIAGGELAGALAYRLFLWFLPFVLVLVGGLGVYAELQNESPAEIADRVGLAGLIVASVAEAASSGARWYAILIGVPILLYVTRTFLRTLGAVHRLAWRLEPHRGLLTPANVLLFLAAMVAFVAVGGLFTTNVGAPDWSWLVVLPAIVVARGAIWLAVSARLPRAEAPWTALAPGAALVGVGFLGVNVFTVVAIDWIVESRADAYGAFGVAAAVLFSLWIASRVLVLSAVLNATLWEREAEAEHE